MAITQRRQTTSYSTHAVQNKLRRTESLHPIPTEPGPCKLVVAVLGPNASHIVDLPCFHYFSDSVRFEDYLRHYKQHLADFLAHIYSPFILPFCCAAGVAQSLASILRYANAAHSCRSGEFTSVHRVQLSLNPLSGESAEMHRALRESFEEAGRVKARPASVASMVELVRARAREEREEGDRFESGWSDRKDRQCVICIEEIEKRKSSLRMPCLHVFHQNCLLNWLNNSHVCPLCRYKMPS